MTGPVLFIERGAIETRAVLLENNLRDKNGPRRFWFGPAMGAEGSDHAPLKGRCFAGRVRAVNASLNAAFVDIGAREDAFVRLNRQTPPEEGALVTVKILTPPRQSKGARAGYLGLADPDLAIGRIPPFPPAPLESYFHIGEGAALVVVDHPSVRDAFSGHDLDLRTGETGGDEIEAALDQALSPHVALAGGGALIIEETAALVAIDVDTGAQMSPSPDRMREEIIDRAARESARQILLRNLAGRIVIDFPSLKANGPRKRVADRLSATLASLPGVSSVTVSRGNLAVINREREASTLLEQASEPTADDPAPGRRFTLDWQVRRAVRRAERRQARLPQSRLAIHAGEALFTAIADRRGEIERQYFERWSVALSIEGSRRLGAREFEIVE